MERLCKVTRTSFIDGENYTQKVTKLIISSQSMFEPEQSESGVRSKLGDWGGYIHRTLNKIENQ